MSPTPQSESSYAEGSLAQERSHGERLELTLSRIFADDTPLEQSLARFLDFICHADRWSSGAIWLLDTSGTLTRAAGDSDGALAARSLREEDLIWSEETGVAIPIGGSERMLGVIELFTTFKRPKLPEAVRLLHDVGVSVGRLIERHRAAEERVRLQKAIERKGIEWALTFDAIELPIFLASLEGIVVRMNRAGRDLAGDSYTAILGRRIGELGTGEVWRSLDDLVRVVADTRQSCSARAVDDSDRHWDISASVYEGEGEERLILILRDITRIVTLQESVRRGEQLAAMGELVAGVAHEVRNPLFGMLVTLDAYEPLVNKGDDAAEMFASLRMWINRMNQLMEDLLQYGKSWRMELREGRIGDVVEQALAQSVPVANEAGVHVRAEGDGDLRMLMDPTRLAHAVQNVIVNAVQHSSRDDEVLLMVGRDEHGDIECAVRDHGPGFAATDLSRVFQPFFTRRRGGTGLGLSIVQRVVDEHGGSVVAENAAGGGALVRMRFPEYRPTDQVKE